MPQPQKIFTLVLTEPTPSALFFRPIFVARSENAQKQTEWKFMKFTFADDHPLAYIKKSVYLAKGEIFSAKIEQILQNDLKFPEFSFQKVNVVGEAKDDHGDTVPVCACLFEIPLETLKEYPLLAHVELSVLKEYKPES